MAIRDRVIVSGTKISLVMIQGPPRVAWVLSIKEVLELVDALVPAVEAAEHHLKNAPISSPNDYRGAFTRGGAKNEGNEE